MGEAMTRGKAREQGSGKRMGKDSVPQRQCVVSKMQQEKNPSDSSAFLRSQLLRKEGPLITRILPVGAPSKQHFSRSWWPGINTQKGTVLLWNMLSSASLLSGAAALLEIY